LIIGLLVLLVASSLQTTVRQGHIYVSKKVKILVLV
jgi:hypothetical protein